MTGVVSLAYKACPTKRTRRSKCDIDDLKRMILAVVGGDHPMTVRQCFYQLVVRAVLEKLESEYQRTVVRLLTEMRLRHELPFAWIVDHTRRRRVTATYDSMAEAVENTARYYRRSALEASPVYIEIWCEKDALSGILWDVTSDYDVPLLVSRGMPSITFLHATAEHIRHEWEVRARSSVIYQLGDHDPTGVLIPKTIECRLREFCPGMPFSVERIALTEQQIDEYRLPTRPTKREGNSHAKAFAGESVELDALAPRILKAITRDAIERHISPAVLSTLRAAEESERDLLRAWAEGFEAK